MRFDKRILIDSTLKKLKKNRGKKMVENSQIRQKLRKQGFPEPIPLSWSVIDCFSTEEKQILSKLANLAEKEHELCLKIYASRPNKPGILIQEDGIMTFCKNEEDWKKIIAKFQRDLNQVQEEIKQNLEKSLDCGLHHLGFIQRKCEDYGIKP
jgi:predicted rRNA methylase YqxC with S4 and FtsJ domains